MHAIRDRERERTQTVVGKDAMVDKQTKYPYLSGDGRVAHKQTSSGRQVLLDQTKVVKG